jgi:hypothetical protein
LPAGTAARGTPEWIWVLATRRPVLPSLTTAATILTLFYRRTGTVCWVRWWRR